MANFSNYLENEIINQFLRGAATPHVTIHVGDPGEDGTGTAGLTRQPVAFDPPVNGATTNSGAVSFPAAAAGTYTHVTVWDALAAGNCLYSGPLTTSKTSDGTDTLVFNAGDLDITNT